MHQYIQKKFSYSQILPVTYLSCIQKLFLCLLYGDLIYSSYSKNNSLQNRTGILEPQNQ